MKLTLISAIICIILLSRFSFSQVDFDEYLTLRSIGMIPSDFTKETYTKLAEDLEEGRDQLTKTQERIFLEGTNYAIDEILHSGLVIYGDEISKYVTEIADRLLRNNDNLRVKLRFYTIKSNSANAFSTDQGIVFVTTGLVSQLTSEAQLAYVLAHEISHYTEKHVVETFDWKTNNYRQNDRIERLSHYSKEKEFEADKIGIKLYNQAGYAVDEIFSTFDVLMYSYLPFDEIEFPSNYFNSEKIFIPKNFYPTKKYEIKAIEDYDDENSSHPNIKKRKEAAEIEVGTFSNWQESTQFLGETRFNLVRDIARFECVRSSIIDASYGDAVYSIFLLEKNYPNSLYLKRMKAQVWLNMMLYKSENISAKTMTQTSELEGESASVHFLLKKLSKDGLTTLALRQIYELKLANPNDHEIQAVYQRFVLELSTMSNFKIESYSKKTFEEASNDFISAMSDSTKQIADTTSKSSSKYDRIKNKKNADNPSNFDSTKFYIYGLSDLIADSSFTKIYQNFIDVKKSKDAEEEKLNSLTNKERNKIEVKKEINRLKLGIEEIIVVEPKVYSYKGTNMDMDPVKSEKIEKIFSNAIEVSATSLGVKVYSIDRRNLSIRGTESFNERNTLISFLSQIAQEDDINVFPVDYSDLKEIRQHYGTSKVLFTLVEHQKSVDINWWMVGGSMVLYPTFPFTVAMYIPMKIFQSNHTEMNIIILDLDKGVVETGENYNWEEPIYKHNLGSHMYNIFHDLKSKPL